MTEITKLELVEQEELPIDGEAKFAAVDIKSGEECYDAVLVLKGKIYRFDEGENQWKERGQGDAKILQKKNNPAEIDFVFRREGIGKLAAFHTISKGMKMYTPTEKQCKWATPADYADGEGVGWPELFLLKFATKELCDQFKAKWAEVTK